MSTFQAPRKRFGQNFLHDQNVIHKIVAAIHPQATDTVVEIGPGRGALTLPILEQVAHLHVVEIDRDLVVWWQGQQRERLSVHAADALKVDLCALAPGESLRVIGNLPYNISTPLLFHLFEQQGCIRDMHFMLQKEVVERMTAGPGSKIYGRLSLMTQFYCQARQLFTVSPHSFHPVPKVESAIVQLIPHPSPYPVDARHFAQVVQQAFSQRRKTLRNALGRLFDAETISALDIDPGARPETLDLKAFLRLAQALPTTQD